MAEIEADIKVVTGVLGFSGIFFAYRMRAVCSFVP